MVISLTLHLYQARVKVIVFIDLEASEYGFIDQDFTQKLFFSLGKLQHCHFFISIRQIAYIHR